MSTIATLLLWGGMALGAMALVTIVVHKHDAGVKLEALAPWEPLTKECENTKMTPAQCAAQWDTLKTANVTLQGDFHRLDGERQACNASVGKLADATDEAIKAKNEKLAEAKLKILGLKANQDALQASLTNPPVAGETCEKILSRIDASSDVIGTRRLRDYPPKPAGADGGNQPAGARQGGNDTLRITQ